MLSVSVSFPSASFRAGATTVKASLRARTLLMAASLVAIAVLALSQLTRLDQVPLDDLDAAFADFGGMA